MEAGRLLIDPEIQIWLSTMAMIAQLEDVERGEDTSPTANAVALIAGTRLKDMGEEGMVNITTNKTTRETKDMHNLLRLPNSPRRHHQLLDNLLLVPLSRSLRRRSAPP